MRSSMKELTLRSMAARPPTVPGTCFVALLRGLNVGAHNRLSMADLAAAFSTHGALDVRTYIQSGNVVFRSSRPHAARVATAVTRGLADQFGIHVPMTLRTGSDLIEVTTHNPFLPHAEPETLHVAFLAQTPKKACAAALDANRSPKDSFRLVGSELYLHLPNGVSNSKLTTAYLDATLGTTVTVRNWRTILALAELCRAILNPTASPIRRKS